MIRIAFGIAVTMLIWSASAHAANLRSVEVSSESRLLTAPVLEPPLPGFPGLIVLEIFSTDPTTLEFAKDEEAFSFDLTFQLFNSTATEFEGIRFDLGDGLIREVPALTLTGLADATSLSIEASDQFILLGPFLPGAFPLNTLYFGFPEGSTATLTITPLLPEPGVTALLLAMAPLTLSRRRPVAG